MSVQMPLRRGPSIDLSETPQLDLSAVRARGLSYGASAKLVPASDRSACSSYIVVYKQGDPCTEFVVSSDALRTSDVDGWLASCAGMSSSQRHVLRKALAAREAESLAEGPLRGLAPISLAAAAPRKLVGVAEVSPVSVCTSTFEPPPQHLKLPGSVGPAPAAELGRLQLGPRTPVA